MFSCQYVTRKDPIILDGRGKVCMQLIGFWWRQIVEHVSTRNEEGPIVYIFYCRELWMEMETIPHTATAIPMSVHDPTLPQVQPLTKWVCPCHLQPLQKLKIQSWSPRVWSSGPGWMSGEWKQTSYGSFDLSVATHLTVIVSRETGVRPFKVVCQASEWNSSNRS